MSNSYYKNIDGKNYDREMLEIADEAVAGVGDGRISVEDAQKLLGAVKDANKYTDIEKATMHYIRANYKFTYAADQWFRTEIRKWAATKGKENDEIHKQIPEVNGLINQNLKKKIEKANNDLKEYSFEFYYF